MSSKLKIAVKVAVLCVVLCTMVIPVFATVQSYTTKIDKLTLGDKVYIDVRVDQTCSIVPNVPAESTMSVYNYEGPVDHHMMSLSLSVWAYEEPYGWFMLGEPGGASNYSTLSISAKVEYQNHYLYTQLKNESTYNFAGMELSPLKAITENKT